MSKQIISEQKQSYFKSNACVFFSGVALLLTLYVIIFLEPGHYHSDCTDSLMWAQASYEAGALVNPDFNYAGLLPLGGNVIMWPLVAIFGVGMKAQIIGMTAFSILFALSLAWLCRQLRFNGNWTACTVAAVMIMLSSSEKLREIFYGHIIYYSLGVLLLASMLAATFRIVRLYREGRRNRMFWSGMLPLAAFCFIAGVDGFQLVSLCAVPAAAAVAAYIFFDIRHTVRSKTHNPYFVALACMAAGLCLGMLFAPVFTGGVTSGYMNAHSVFGDIENWTDNFLRLIPAWLSLSGVEIKSGTGIFSISGIGNLLRIAGALVLLAVPVAMLFFYRRLGRAEYKTLLLAHHFLFLVLTAGWTLGMLNTANWRLSPMLVTSALCCIVFAKWIYETGSTKRMALLLAVPVGCIALISATGIVTADRRSPENEQLESLAVYLENQNLEYGYATFWNANIVTMISDSKVKIRNIRLDESGAHPEFYQSNTGWYSRAEGYERYFIAMTSLERADYYDALSNAIPPDEVLEYGGYTIFVYDNNIF